MDLVEQILRKLKTSDETDCYSVFNEWGIPTAASIVEAKNSSCMIDVISSGGIQTSLDIAKSIALGANTGWDCRFLLENI